VRLPDLRAYQIHKVIDDIDLEGVVVPGLRGTFHRRPRDGRVETVGLYAYRGAELFMAWGLVGEAHCRYTAYRSDDGWTSPELGCPAIRIIRANGHVRGVDVGGHILTGHRGPGRLAAAGLGECEEPTRARVPVS